MWVHGTKYGLDAEDYYGPCLQVAKIQNSTKLLKDNSIFPNNNVRYTKFQTAIRNKLGHDHFIQCVFQRGNFFDIVKNEYPYMKEYQ